MTKLGPTEERARHLLIIALRDALAHGEVSISARVLYRCVGVGTEMDDRAFAQAIEYVVSQNIVVPKFRDDDWVLDITMRGADRLRQRAGN